MRVFRIHSTFFPLWLIICLVNCPSNSSSVEKRPSTTSFRKSKYSPEKRQMRPRSTPVGLERMFRLIRDGAPQQALQELDRMNLFYASNTAPILPTPSLSSSSSMSPMKISQTHYHELIKELGEQGYLNECDEVLVKMKTQNIKPTVLTYNHLISRSAQWKQTDRAEQYFRNMQRENIRPDARIYNCLINSYTKSGELDQAKIILGQMKKNKIVPTVVTFNTLIDGVVRLKQKQSNVSKVDQAMEILESMEEHNIKPNLRTYSSLIHVYCDTGMPDKGYELLLRMRDMYGMTPPYVSFSILVHSYGQEGDLSKAFEILHYMKSSGYVPNVTTLSSLIAACGKQRQLNLAFSLYRDMWNAADVHDKPNTITCSSLIDSCLKLGEVDQALGVLSDMRRHGVTLTQVTYTSMMCELTKLKRFDIIQELTANPYGGRTYVGSEKGRIAAEGSSIESIWRDQAITSAYHQSNIDVVSSVLPSLLSGSQLTAATANVSSSSGSSFDRQVREYEALKKQGRAPAPEFYQTLLKSLYSETLQKPSMVPVTSDMTSFTPIPDANIAGTQAKAGDARTKPGITRRNDDLFRLYLVFQEMRDSGVQPDIVAYNMLINAAAGAGALDNVLETVETMQREGVSPDVITYTSIIKAAGINGGPGTVALAEEIFATMQQRTNHFSSYVEPSLLTFERLIQTHMRAKVAASSIPPSQQNDSIPTYSSKSDVTDFSTRQSITGANHGVDTRRVWELFQDMKSRGIRPNIAIYRYVIKAVLLEENVSRAMSLVDEIRRGESADPNLTFDGKIWNSVLSVCVAMHRGTDAEILRNELMNKSRGT